MEASQRREELLKLLQMDIKPMSANNLAERFSVSRQIIVGDVALLRASGHNILATQNGYILDKPQGSPETDTDTYILACRHDKGQLEAELHAIVDNGGVLLNVSVDHPLYGSITQPLEIRSRFEANALLNKIAVTGASLLCALTGGAHLHTVRCQSPEAYRRILDTLKRQGILYTA